MVTHCYSGTFERFRFSFIFFVISVPCDHEALQNGDVTYTLDGNEHALPVHGVIRRFSCDAGFIIDDNEPSRCDAGTWTRRLPVCHENTMN